MRRLLRPFVAALFLCVAIGGFAVVGAVAGERTTGQLVQAPVSTDAPEVVGSSFTRGSTVAGTFGEWKGDAPTRYAFEWLRCDAAGTSCVPIVGATGELVTLATADVGRRLRVTVKATNTSGDGEETSAASPLIGPSDGPLNDEVPVLTGTARVGGTLVVDSGSWTGGTPISFAFAWWRCEPDGDRCAPIDGALDETYVVQSADVGHALRGVVRASNSAGANTAVTRLTATVGAAAAPVNVAPPTISGVPIGGQTLTASSGSWTGTLPISFAYQWRRCDASGAGCVDIAGATGAAYVLGSSDLGRTLRVRVTATNAAGAAAVASTATEVVGSLAAPVNQTRPTIAGVARQGEFLTADRGSWTGTPTDYDYQWQRCNTQGVACQNVTGAIGRAYRLGIADVNWRLRVRVTARNSAGSGTAFSGVTAPVKPSAPVNTGLPTISGALHEGETLTAAPGSWTSFSTVTFTYHWVRCPREFVFAQCAPIAGARRQTYALTSSDVGRRLFVQVKAQNATGATFANSAPTSTVIARGSGTARPTGAIPVSVVSLPNRLVISRVTFTPRQITRHDQLIALRVLVTETQGQRPVRGALVYAVGVPFDRLTPGREAATDDSGWATISFRTRATFPLRAGNLVVLFVRARKPNESVLAGVSNRRLVSIRIG